MNQTDPIPKVKSCGVILFREHTDRQFLLMKHARRYDLPKGHMERGEDELSCALRELQEETGITNDEVRIDSVFRFEHTYSPRYKRLGGRRVTKTVVIFLGWLRVQAEVLPTEHAGHEWIEWSPPHGIQANTIDPLLFAVEEHLAKQNVD
jgi:bis(5'-nucleosidyl)-tetraphosphatase